VVGILTSERNAGLESLLAAYGISELKSRIEKMANGEALSYLGITGMDVTREANERLGVPFGAYILSVEMDSPAMTAGLQAGDIVTSMNGSVISSMYDYSSQLQSRREGDSVELRVQRQVQDEYKEIIVTMVVEGRS
jgi:serine protease Do